MYIVPMSGQQLSDRITSLRKHAAQVRLRPDLVIKVLIGDTIEPIDHKQAKLMTDVIASTSADGNRWMLSPEVIAQYLERQARLLELASTFH